MDPINKWLTVIIGFMIALLIVISYKAGSGRYEFTVKKSVQFSDHAVVYVLDTKKGDVYAKLVDVQYNNLAKNKPQKMFKLSSTGYSTSRGY